MNTVCDHCLLFAYADQVRRITHHMVEEAIQYLDEGEPRSRERRGLRGWYMTPLRWTLLAASAVAAGLAALISAHSDAARWLLNLAASSLSELARSTRALLPR